MGALMMEEEVSGLGAHGQAAAVPVGRVPRGTSAGLAGGWVGAVYTLAGFLNHEAGVGCAAQLCCWCCTSHVCGSEAATSHSRLPHPGPLLTCPLTSRCRPAPWNSRPGPPGCW
jgi:hypothetical protein